MGLFRKRSPAQELVEALVAVGDMVRVLVTVEKIARDNAPLLVEALKCLAPHKPIPFEWGEPRSSAFSGLVGGLGNAGVRAAIPQLLRYCKAEELNDEVVDALASIGSEDCLPTCLRALESPDEHVRMAVASGAAKCAERGDGDQRFLRAIFDALVRMATTPGSPSTERVEATLIALHPARAVEVLTSSAALSIENRRLHELLKALNEAHILVEPSILEALRASTKPLSKRYPFEYAYGQILVALARSAPGAARPHLLDALESEESCIRDKAIDALLESTGLVPLYRNYSDIEFEQWPKEHQIAAFLAHLILSVETDGISGIFCNHSPSWWKEAVEHLELVDAKQCAAVVRHCARLLGRDNPNLTEADLDGMPGWIDRAGQAEPELAKQWALDKLPVLVCRYMVARPEKFRRVQDDLPA